MIGQQVSRMYRTVIMLMVLHAVVSLQLLKTDDLNKYFDGQNNSLYHIRDEGNPNYFRYLQIINNKLYVGAMNYVFVLSLADLSLLKSKYLEVADNKCQIQAKNEYPDCQNHIRVIMEIGDEVFVCGTGAYAPQKYMLNSTNLNVTDGSQGSGVALCPFDPMDNSTALYVADGNPGNRAAQYFGTYRDFLKDDGVIYRPAYSANGTAYAEKMTDIEYKGWLNSPQFVGSFDMVEDQEVYFFFREIAVEYDDQKVVSRVAKVCKQDLGGGSMKDKWLSYQKARLLCYLPGKEPYYFDEIYDVYRVGDTFYVLFHKHGNILEASAVCMYNKSDIENSFRGNFKTRTQTNCNNWIWETLATKPDPQLTDCSLHTPANTDLFKDKVSEYQIMDTEIEPLYGEAIYYKADVQFLKLIVDAGTSHRNIYLATDKGTVYSLFMKDNSQTSQKPFVAEHAIYRPFESMDKKYAIWSMKLQDDALYLGTDYNVTKLDLSNQADKLPCPETCIYDTRYKWACGDVLKCCPKSDTSCCLGEVTISADDVADNGTIPVTCMQAVTRTALKDLSRGVYATLDIISKLCRSGQTIWKKDNVTLTFDDACSTCNTCSDCKYFLASNTGSLIIRNVTEGDGGVYQAYDKTTTSETLIADYDVAIPLDSKAAIIDAWKQSFADWSLNFKKWQGCSSAYLETCSAPGN